MTKNIIRDVRKVIMLYALFTTQSYAAPIFFTDESSFQTALALASNTLATESFETVFTETPSVNFSGFSATVIGGGNLLSVPSAIYNAIPTDGVRTIGIVDNQFNGNILTFQFNRPINLFAIDILGALDVFSGGTLSLSIENSASQIILTAPQPREQRRFGGLIDDAQAFSRVTITSTQTGDGIQFDRLQFGEFSNNSGSNIPEPGTISLVFLGLVGLGLSKRMSTLKRNQ
ncbi:MAG: PEP-CTERM sorting domain-containing protein [Methylomicrobium sp.]|nr:PEP-CTERM sorting domain-containing protein [Methylomicrobium sp.]PPD24028.1 MAG: hypothetical protein CTY24_02375 [Methylobacter sp.]